MYRAVDFDHDDASGVQVTGFRPPGERWYVDETYVKVNGVWRYVYRAVDQRGQVIDVLLTVHRDAAAARRLFTRCRTR